MNTRLQVEHTVTEMVTGLDIVALQIEVALGGSLAELDGGAARARDPVPDQRGGPGRNFLPGPGRITRYEEPGGPFVRVDSGVSAGREHPRRLRLDVRQADRVGRRPGAGAPTACSAALDEFVVEGVPTTIPVHRWILESKAFRDATHTTTWLERALVDARPARPGRPRAALRRPGRRRARRDILVEVDGRRVPVRIFDERREPRPRRPDRHGAHHGEHVHGEIRAPMQGTIVKVLVEKGQQIQAGDVVCILEAMKMENHIASTREGEISDLPIRAGQVVETGQVLAVID